MDILSILATQKEVQILNIGLLTTWSGRQWRLSNFPFQEWYFMASRRDLANAIRALSMDAVQQANSGHPGAPMGMADIAEVLWNDYLSHNPADPSWANRDRFVLSNGHGSMLLYSLLHLSGYDLPIEEIKNFRQLHSKTNFSQKS